MRYINKIQTSDPKNEVILIKGQQKYVCCVCGRICHRKIKSYGHVYCSKHYEQLKEHGHPLDSNPRNPLDRNEIRIDGDVAYIDLYDEKCEVVATAIIDAEDVSRIRYAKWKLSRSGYVMNDPKFKGGSVHLSRAILGADGYVEHGNHNTQDNRKANLRLVTESPSEKNCEMKGIRQTENGRYIAYIKKNQRKLNLGEYVYREEAEYARWYAEQQLFGEQAYPREAPAIADYRVSAIREYVGRKVQRL